MHSTPQHSTEVGDLPCAQTGLLVEERTLLSEEQETVTTHSRFEVIMQSRVIAAKEYPTSSTVFGKAVY
jgi:hypothetical protein